MSRAVSCTICSLRGGIATKLIAQSCLVLYKNRLSRALESIVQHQIAFIISEALVQSYSSRTNISFSLLKHAFTLYKAKGVTLLPKLSIFERTLTIFYLNTMHTLVTPGYIQS